MASAATVGSNLIEGQTVQIKEGPPLFEDEGKDFPKPKPCEKSSSKREAEGLEGKKETEEVTLNLESAPKLDAREISLDEVLSKECEAEGNIPQQVEKSADEPENQNHDSGFYSLESINLKVGSEVDEVDSLSQLSRDAPGSDVEPSDPLIERTDECSHLAEAGDQERQKNGNRESKNIKCHITKDKEEIENKKTRGKSIDNAQDMKCRINKKPRHSLISSQEFRILRKALPEMLDLQSGWDWTTLDMKKEWFRLASFASLTYRRFYKLSPVLLATAGNPSCNKRAFKDTEGRLIQCKNMCGPNTFFMDVSHMLIEFPALKDAFKSCRTGRLILEMFEHGKLNSARGIYHILRHLEIVNPEDTVVDQTQSSYKLDLQTPFYFLAHRDEVRGSLCYTLGVGVGVRTWLNPPCLKTRDGKMNIIQQGILKFFEDLCPSNKCCDHCQETVCLTFSHPPPPVLFINVLRLNFPPVGAFEDLPAVVYVLGHKYRVGMVYVHKDQHFTGWIYKNQAWTYYDDSKVSPGDKYSADLDETKEFPGNELKVVVSYYLINNGGP
uniref:Uncharacterized protein n=1 Tax=Magallana gigas TaxID=29159 RepID=K1Q5D4_MAGGI